MYTDKFYKKEAPAVPIIALAVTAAGTAHSIAAAEQQKKKMKQAEAAAAAEKAKAQAELDAEAEKKKQVMEGAIKSSVGGSEARYGGGTILSPISDTSSIFK